MMDIEAPPKASILIESMRDIGYSLETALADVIDNSISASAKKIDILVDTVGGEVRIGILDDGIGMSRDELHDAMRLGSRHPREARGKRDLGRFGLGLKTASFSQCRRLTVVARQKGITSAATWDLGHVAKVDRWALQIRDDVSAIPFADRMIGDGVLVLWEDLDRAVDTGEADAVRKHFIRRVDETREHLELVFHRYLAGERGLSRVSIEINGLPLKPFDPFNTSNDATICGQTENVKLGDSEISITPFTLPHHRNATEAEWHHYAGKAGYLKNQGFYLYREKRLIIHGTWFGLARQAELTKLCRVRIDMPNGLDEVWQVDVKKAWARPPLQVRQRLQTLIGQLGAPSKRIFTKRGATLHGSSSHVWHRVQENNAITYRLNTENGVIQEFAESLPAHLKEPFARLVQSIAAALPMDAIFADLAGSPESVKQQRLADETMLELLRISVSSLRKGGLDYPSIPEVLRVMEPFRSDWNRAEQQLAELLMEAADD